jgi:hypothetical protein
MTKRRRGTEPDEPVDKSRSTGAAKPDHIADILNCLANLRGAIQVLDAIHCDKNGYSGLEPNPKEWFRRVRSGSPDGNGVGMGLPAAGGLTGILLKLYACAMGLPPWRDPTIAEQLAARGVPPDEALETVRQLGIVVDELRNRWMATVRPNPPRSLRRETELSYAQVEAIEARFRHVPTIDQIRRVSKVRPIIQDSGRRRRRVPSQQPGWIEATEAVRKYDVSRSTLQSWGAGVLKGAHKKDPVSNAVLFDVKRLEELLRAKGRLRRPQSSSASDTLDTK